MSNRLHHSVDFIKNNNNFNENNSSLKTLLPSRTIQHFKNKFISTNGLSPNASPIYLSSSKALKNSNTVSFVANYYVPVKTSVRFKIGGLSFTRGRPIHIPGGHLIETHSNYDYTQKTNGIVLESPHFRTYDGMMQKINNKMYSYFYLKGYHGTSNVCSLLIGKRIGICRIYYIAGNATRNCEIMLKIWIDTFKENEHIRNKDNSDDYSCKFVLSSSAHKSRISKAVA